MNYDELDGRFPLGEDFASEIKAAIRVSLQAALPGQFSGHQDYPVYYTRTEHPVQSRIDELPLQMDRLPKVVVQWAGLEPGHGWGREDLLVLDLETTGLGRGGTLAFLIGLGFYEGDRFVVEQIFLPEPEAELNSFEFLQQRLEEKALIVTFNGKTFDLPVLESRFLVNNLWLPLRQRPHLDVLHLARRLWKNRAPSCNLETLEYYILGHIRDRELDIPGSLIPQTYYQFLMNGDPELIRRIFLHNQSDVLHTAVLLALIADSVRIPIPAKRDLRIDYCAVARLYTSQGFDDHAIDILTALFEDDQVTAELVYDLGILHKRWGEYQLCRRYFGIGAELLHPPSMLEYAILLERRLREYPAALKEAERLLKYLQTDTIHDLRDIWAAEKRVKRLRHRIETRAQKDRVKPV
ncbi:MAG: ribonuclease H-like domain-containing protein [Candidatus Cloacimonetes bacterium]|nr:ribonuclease H-like domain-containing protein [Candidatus Cloacimonadota bacterium]